MKWINQAHWIHLWGFCQQLSGILLFSLVSDNLSSRLAACNTGDINITNILHHCTNAISLMFSLYSRPILMFVENNEVAGTESLIWQNSHAISSSIEILGNPSIFTFLLLVVRTNYRILCRILSLHNIMHLIFNFLNIR